MISNPNRHYTNTYFFKGGFAAEVRVTCQKKRPYTFDLCTGVFFIFPTQRYGSDARSSFLSVLVLKIRQNIQFADLARIGAEGMQLDIVGFKLIEETGVVHQIRIIDQDAL